MIRAAASLTLIVAMTAVVLPPVPVAAQDVPVVKAVFFYMPTCDHCHRVVEETLPPVMQRFGDQLVIVFVDVSGGAGLDLFYSVMDHFAIPSQAQGVPLMAIGSEVLNGDIEIPARLAEVVEAGLDGGGVDWPDIPGMEAIADLSTGGPTSASGEPSVGPLPDMTPPTMREHWAADPAAFGITLVTLAAMVATVAWVVARWLRAGLATGSDRGLRDWVIPALCAIGIIAAAYLAYVETTSSKAVCGPVGDCNAVQQSEYAQLFGVLPVGVLGLFGYLAIVALWAWQRYGPRERTRRTRWLLPGLLLFGVGFSIYLTLLELFVIQAICMWCVTSAVVMTLLLWAVSLGWAEPGAASGRAAG